MKNVTITKHITLNLTAEDWDLYTCMDNIEYVAKDLNTHITDIFNSNDAPTAFAKATIILEQYSEFGAADTEPYQCCASCTTSFLQTSCNKILGVYNTKCSDF
jgi:hypothetical protein